MESVEFKKKNHGEIFGETNDFLKESLEAFLEKSVYDFPKELSYDSGEFYGGILIETHKSLSRSFFGKFLNDPLMKFPNKILGIILKQSIEDVLTNFRTDSVEDFRRSYWELETVLFTSSE